MKQVSSSLIAVIFFLQAGIASILFFVTTKWPWYHLFQLVSLMLPMTCAVTLVVVSLFQKGYYLDCSLVKKSILTILIFQLITALFNIQEPYPNSAFSISFYESWIIQYPVMFKFLPRDRATELFIGGWFRFCYVASCIIFTVCVICSPKTKKSPPHDR